MRGRKGQPIIPQTDTAHVSPTAQQGGGGGGNGTVATFTAISRDTLAAAGGETLIATVTGIVGTPDNPTINGTPATGITIVDSTHISFVSPALSEGGPYDIALGGRTLTACVTVMAAITTTYASATFDDSTAGTWDAISDNNVNGTSGSHTFSTDHLLPGSTKSLKCTIAGPTSGDCILHKLTTNNPMLNNTNGLFVRFFVYANDALVTALQTSGRQQKFHLNRGPNLSNPPSWGMIGVGAAFHAKRLTLVQDNGTNTKYFSTFDMGDAAGWVEVQIQMNRKGGTGTITLWINGTKVFTETATAYGNDNSGDSFTTQIGAVYSIVDSTVNSYFENAAVADGYIGSNV